MKQKILEIRNSLKFKNSIGLIKFLNLKWLKLCKRHFLPLLTSPALYRSSLRVIQLARASRNAMYLTLPQLEKKKLAGTMTYSRYTGVVCQH